MSQKLIRARAMPAARRLPEQHAKHVDYIYEQPPEQTARTLLPRYVETEVYRALLESAAAEHAARMTAMDAASSNAAEMIDKLTLYMNRVRQASITKRDYRSGERRETRWSSCAGDSILIMETATQTQVVGKVIQVAGPAVDLQFPEGQIPLIYTAIRITSEGFDVPAAHRHHLRSAAAHRRRPRAHHRAAAHRRAGARHEGHQPGRAR